MNTDQIRRYGQAQERFDAGKLEEAIREMRLLCAEGCSRAHVFLGWVSQVGRMGSIDIAEAKRCYTAAADDGDPIGQFYLGLLLLHQAEFSGALNWIRRAAEQDYAPALYHLGKLLMAGRGCAKDEQGALVYMRKAATAGHPFAQRWIAVRGLTGGEGVEGFVQALRWFASVPMLAFRMGTEEPADANILRP